MLHSEASQQISDFVRHLTGLLCKTPAVITNDFQDDVLRVDIQAGSDGRFLIGKNGTTLEALEHVVRLAAVRVTLERVRISVDVNDYRKTQLQERIVMAQAMVDRIRSTRRPETLPPMTPAQRRAVHTELAVHRDITTESTGEEPNRRITIRLL